MGLFERYLSVWVGLCILAGVLLGNLMPAMFQVISTLEYAHVNLVVAVLIWVMIYPMMVQIDFGSIKDVKVLNRQKYFIEQFKDSGVVFSQAYGSSNSLYNVPRYVMEFIVYSGMVLLILTLLYFSSNNISEVLPVLAIFGMAAFKLLPSFQQIYGSAAQIKSNSSASFSVSMPSTDSITLS